MNPRLKDPIYFFIKAGEDYIAGRCLISHSFFQPGGALIAQSAEKLLKAISKFHGVNVSKIHKLSELSKGIESHVDLSKHNNFISLLDEIYLARYIDNGISWDF